MWLYLLIGAAGSIAYVDNWSAWQCVIGMGFVIVSLILYAINEHLSLISTNLSAIRYKDDIDYEDE